MSHNYSIVLRCITKLMMVPHWGGIHTDKFILQACMERFRYVKIKNWTYCTRMNMAADLVSCDRVYAYRYDKGVWHTVFYRVNPTTQHFYWFCTRFQLEDLCTYCQDRFLWSGELVAGFLREPRSPVQAGLWRHANQLRKARSSLCSRISG